MHVGKIKFVKNLDDAYKKGYFSGSLRRNELLDMIIKNHDDLHYIYGKNAIGLYNRNRYIAAIGYINPIPKFTLMQETSKKVLAKGYPAILEIIRRSGYEIEYS